MEIRKIKNGKSRGEENKLKKTIALIFGTRPEAIKMAPIYIELSKSQAFKPVVIVTSQHMQMLDQVLTLFSIKPDYDLKVMSQYQTLSQLTSKIITGLDDIFSREKFDLSLVQGDTTSALAGALTSFYHAIPVGHVEAGLRSFDMRNPFPEEANRRLTASIADLHFAPTKRAKQNLINEGINGKKIHITGNTVVDALQWIVKNKSNEIDRFLKEKELKGKKYVYMTMHRRENWGNPMRNVIRDIKKVLQLYPEYMLVFPVHLNPIVRKIAFEELADVKNAILTEPVDYIQSIALIKECDFVLTDSGGLQEEAPTLGKPCLVLRKTTERPEAIEAGTAKLIGTESENVRRKIIQMIEERDEYKKMARSINPFGDGKAAIRIHEILKKFDIEDDSKCL